MDVEGRKHQSARELLRRARTFDPGSDGNERAALPTSVEDGKHCLLARTPTMRFDVCPRCGTPVTASRWCGGCGLNLHQQDELPTVGAYEASVREREWLAADQTRREAADETRKGQNRQQREHKTEETRRIREEQTRLRAAERETSPGSEEGGVASAEETSAEDSCCFASLG